MQLLIHALTSIWVREWLGNYISLFYVDLNTYAGPNFDAGWANLI